MAQHSALSRVSTSMRLRLVVYAFASLLLLAFHAPVRAAVCLFFDFRDLYNNAWNQVANPQALIAFTSAALSQ